MTLARTLATAALLVAIWGCGASTAAPSSPPAASPSAPSGPSLPAPSPVPSAPSSPSPSAPPSDMPVPSAPQLARDSVARVVTSDLRVRSKPEVSDSSKKLSPLLDAPRLVFVVDGPVEASGYTWYEVAPIGDAATTGELPFGWVAAADKDGTPWIQGVTPDCPARPTTVDGLLAVNPVLGLACFGQKPITIEARLGQPEATCGVDLGWTVAPEWLGSTCPQPAFLVGPRTGPSVSFYSVIDPSVDIRSFKPGVEPADWIDVRITGRFDHPAAASCHGVSTSEPVPYGRAQLILGCRATFVITRIAGG